MYNPTSLVLIAHLSEGSLLCRKTLKMLLRQAEEHSCSRFGWEFSLQLGEGSYSKDP